MAHRRFFSANRAMNAVVIGTAGTAAIGLLGWPLIDGLLIPLAFDCAIDKRIHEGRRNWWRMDPKQKSDLEALRQELLGENASMMLLTGGKIETSTLAEELMCDSDSNGVVLDLSGAIDQRILLYANLSSLLDSSSSPFLSKLLLVYIKAVNVFGNLLTGNQDVNHTSFIFYSLFLDHLRTAVGRSHEKTGTRSLIVLNQLNLASNPFPETEDSDYLNLCIEELLFVVRHLVHKGQASVLITSTSTSPEVAKKWINSTSNARYTESEHPLKFPSQDQLQKFKKMVDMNIVREVVGKPLQGGSFLGDRAFAPAEGFEVWQANLV
eukprot:TRINITY_DN4930_c0_g1_i1.p1 TRINITY_DN4930_c0_g1~~TRINITY_DN4930_c0_g1_i1.p1  ORF type:complete len:338 (+),score=40.10 TRINITY_DN4930_c0_g1_i1:48-1016(+)